MLQFLGPLLKLGKIPLKANLLQAKSQHMRNNALYLINGTWKLAANQTLKYWSAGAEGQITPPTVYEKTNLGPVPLNSSNFNNCQPIKVIK